MTVEDDRTSRPIINRLYVNFSTNSLLADHRKPRLIVSFHVARLGYVGLQTSGLCTLIPSGVWGLSPPPLACEDLGGRFDDSFPTCALFKVEIISCTPIPVFLLFFKPGSFHSGSASLDDCDRVFPNELRVSSFPYKFPHYAWTA